MAASALRTFQKPDYRALGRNGEYIRPARYVHELDHADRAPALEQAARNLGIERIFFGQHVYMTLGMSYRQAQADGRPWLLFRGAELPLEYVNGESR